MAQSAYAYDADSRLIGLAETNYLGAPINTYGWAYNANSWITTQNNGDGATVYTYDANGQLLSGTLTASNGQPSNFANNYSYDANGNRTAGTTLGLDNQLLSDGIYTYTYDPEGNRTSRTTIATGERQNYTWDDRNRLTDVSDVNSVGTLLYTTHYTYDSSDRRIGQVVSTYGSTPTQTSEHYVYDASTALGGSGSLVLVTDDTGAVTHRILQGPQTNQVLADQDTSKASTDPTGTTWLLADNQQSVRDVMNSGGIEVDHRVYDSYGNVVSESSPSASPRFGYTGMQTDAATGLLYDRARYYDPQTGSFVSQDPKGFAAGDANLYRYVGNDPANMVDPTGNYSSPMSKEARAKMAADQAATRAAISGAFNSAVSTVTQVASTVVNTTVQAAQSAEKFVSQTATTIADLAGANGSQVQQASWSGFEQGARGGASIAANTLTFGGSDAIGATDSSQYQGADYAGSRAFSGVARDALLTAGTLGVGSLLNFARAGSAGDALMSAVRGLDAGMGALQLYGGATNLANAYQQISDGNYLQGAASIAGAGLNFYGAKNSFTGAFSPMGGGGPEGPTGQPTAPTDPPAAPAPGTDAATGSVAPGEGLAPEAVSTPANPTDASYDQAAAIDAWENEGGALAPENAAENAGAGYATSNAQAQNLARQLTSEEQVGQALSGQGTPLIGAGTNKALLDADRLAQQYGGNPGDWAKMGSESSAAHGVQTPAGNNFETHWYQNANTGQVVEIKTKIGGH